MRVLIGAYACEPDVGSEPGVGWNWSRQAALHGHEVHVVTRTNNRERIDEALRAAPIANLNFHYFDLPSFFLKLKKRTGYYGLVGYYYVWQIGVWFKARKLHRQFDFDLVHHVTFVIDWLPSGISGARAPFVWGPIGGSTNVVPTKMKEFIPKSARRYEFTRRLLQQTFKWLDPFVRSTRRRAAVILTFTQEALLGIPSKYRYKARPIVHIGVQESDVPVTADPPGDEGLMVAAGGRLVHWKGFDLLIEGFARFVEETTSSPHLYITGNGPFRTSMEELVTRSGVGDYVDFLGSLPTRGDVYRVITNCHLYALLTLRDGPPVAILEAMAAGRPVMCLNLGSTAELVPDDAGLKIDVQERKQVVQDVAGALLWANDHLDELKELGRRAREHALSVHRWERIGDNVDEIYREVSMRAHRSSAHS